MSENTINNKATHNYLTYTLAILTAILISIGTYFYTNYEIIKQKDFKTNYIKQSTLSFDNLSSKIKQKYVLIDNITLSNTKELEEEIKRLNSLVNNQETKTIVKTKIITDTKIVNKIIKDTVNINSFQVSKYNVAKCYDMKVNDDQLSPKCKKTISSFLQKNKDASYFEVIGILSSEDFIYLNKFKKNLDVLEKLNVTPSIITRLEKFADFGLANKRVEETIWFINKTSKEKLHIFPANYTITSKSHNKGTIVRAYY